jgi:hypothetical protein
MSIRNHECTRLEVLDGVVYEVTYNQFGEEVAREYYCEESEYDKEDFFDGYGTTVLPWSTNH